MMFDDFDIMEDTLYVPLDDFYLKEDTLYIPLDNFLMILI
jgi:hypothetical protein